MRRGTAIGLCLVLVGQAFIATTAAGADHDWILDEVYDKCEQAADEVPKGPRKVECPDGVVHPCDLMNCDPCAHINCDPGLCQKPGLATEICLNVDGTSRTPVVRRPAAYHDTDVDGAIWNYTYESPAGAEVHIPCAEAQGQVANEPFGVPNACHEIPVLSRSAEIQTFSASVDTPTSDENREDILYLCDAYLTVKVLGSGVEDVPIKTLC